MVYDSARQVAVMFGGRDVASPVLALVDYTPLQSTWEWDGGLEYETQISFTCGPYGSFPDTEVVVATCGWDKTWTPAQLPPCVCRSAVV